MKPVKKYITIACGLILALCAASLLHPGAAEAALRGTGTYTKSVMISINNRVVSIDSGLRDLIRSARVIPVFSMPVTKMKIDNSSIPLARNPGTTDYRIGDSLNPQPHDPLLFNQARDLYPGPYCDSSPDHPWDGGPPRSGTGAPCIGNQYHANDAGDFRLGCQFAHFAYDDPIIYPGQPNKSHLHAFFGGTQTDYLTTPANIRSRSGSTCAGGAFVKSGYWVPALVNKRTGKVKTPDANLVYYKSAYDSQTLGNTIVPMPPGLRMLACSPTGLDGLPATTPCGAQFWTCSVGHTGAAIPRKAQCPEAVAKTGPFQIEWAIQFPRCWDGVNLDGNPAIPGDHATHMASVDAGQPCPAGYPVRFLAVSYNITYTINPDEDLDDFYLSSDDPNGIAGATGHADWFNGWKRGPDYPGDPNDEDIMQSLIDSCTKQMVDCHANFIGPYKSGSTGSTLWRILQ